jgi:hypothetical protein
VKIYCLPDFKDKFDNLSKKKPYKTLEDDLITHFFEKDIEQLKSGVRLNFSQNEPYIKKRLEGRGGYRIYYLLIIKLEAVYLMFVHPKTGPDGADNITDESKAKIYKDVLECIRTNNLFELTLNEIKTKIQFKRL